MIASLSSTVLPTEQLGVLLPHQICKIVKNNWKSFAGRFIQSTQPLSCHLEEATYQDAKKTSEGLQASVGKHLRSSNVVNGSLMRSSAKT